MNKWKLFVISAIAVVFISIMYSFPSENDDITNPRKNQEKNGETLNGIRPPGWPWRGITIVSHIDRRAVTKEKIKKLADQKVNLIRLRLSFRKYSELTGLSVEESIKNTFHWADTIIDWCAANNINVLISHTDFPLDPEIWYNQTSEEFWSSEKDLYESLEYIKRIVKHFDSSKNVVAYEFIAEPVIVGPVKTIRPPNWFEFFNKSLKEIRTISSKHVLFTPGPWGGPIGYSDLEQKINDKKIIYNFHFYQPHRYTHQNSMPNTKYSYPGKVGAKYWNKEALRKDIEIVTQWAERQKVKYIFAGEFSASKFAEGRDRYLKDVLEIFEENKISWAYFSYNGWRGWSDLNDDQYNTNTEDLLEDYWTLNKGKK